MMILDPVKKVPVYDQHLVKPQTDLSLARVTEDVYVPLFMHFSKAIQAFFYNKVPIPGKQLAPIIHLYLKSFMKFKRDKDMANEGIKTLWLIVERAGLKEADLPDLVHE